MKGLMVVLLSATILGCGGGGTIKTENNTSPNPNPTPTPPSKVVTWQPTAGGNWPVSTPSAEGLDQNKIIAAYNAGAAVSGLQSMLVMRRGQLVAETYYGSRTATTQFQLRSATTTVMANLIGIAIAQGKIRSVNQPITDFLSKDYAALLTNKGGITIAHLLTMSSGISWDETTVDGYTPFATAADPTRYVLQQGVLNAPGTRFNYNSGGMHLLSVIISKATGMTTAQYAQQVLFTPLGISNYQWEMLTDGFNNGASGLQLTARDFAKLAVLWQQDGVWQSKRVLPAGWQDLAKSLSQTQSRQIGGLAVNGYGYGWWLAQSGSPGNPAQLAWGWGGQFALTIPALDFTVITLADPKPSNVALQEGNIMSLLYRQILPAIQ